LPAASGNFLKDLEQIERLAVAPAMGATLLARNLNYIYERLARARFSDYDLRAVAEAAPEVMYRLFDLRVSLRHRVSEFARDGYMTPEVTATLREVFRVLRYVSDMLGEIATGNTRPPPGGVRRAFTGADLSTLTNANYYRAGMPIGFRSGDIIMVRGQTHNSAAIARIGGAAASQFSHIAVVYIDDSGAHWIVESLIEDGAIIHTLSDFLEHHIVRAVLYRHHDTALATRAAKTIYDLVSQSRASRGKRILYDFTMRLDDESPNLFCAKLVRLAYGKASDDEYEMPTYPTRIFMKNRDFLDRIGVAAEYTFAPADIDLEPGFDLVAEWQDYSETSNVRLQDFTMDKIFEWMDRYGYRFEETPAVKLVSILGRFASHFSDNAKRMLESLFPRVPSNMSRKTIAAVAMLHKTAEPIYHEMQALERDHVDRTGFPMQGLDIFQALESVRVRDGNRIGYLVRG